MSTTCQESEELTKEKLLALLPKKQNGDLKGGEEAKEISRLLNFYRYTQKDLRIFKAQIDVLCEHYGHSGIYFPKRERTVPAFR